MIYFTSDLHLGHRGIIGMQNRPFENVQEMNQVLIRNYNVVVHKMIRCISLEISAIIYQWIEQMN